MSNQTLELDNEGVRLLRNGLIEQQVRWADLVEVRAITTDDGPLSEDLWLMLIGMGKTGCAVPSEIEGFEALRDRVFKLPRFDFEKWIEACGSADKHTFVCWKRSSP